MSDFKRRPPTFLIDNQTIFHYRRAFMTFDHVAIHVTHLDETIAWFRALYSELEILYQDETWAFLQTSGGRIALVTNHQHPPHIAFRVTEERLAELAQQYGKSVKKHRDNTVSFYVEAPGKNWIEFIAYPSDSLIH